MMPSAMVILLKSNIDDDLLAVGTIGKTRRRYAVNV